jgi:SEC-C motif-containing protein
MLCPCGSSKELKQCCELIIEGKKAASSPEELMRSRYTAFATHKFEYLVQTTDPQTRMQMDMKANEEWARSSKFSKLEILNSSEDGNKGLVEFKATYQTGEEPQQVHHEFSKFRKQAGVWYFREGRVKAPANP